MSVTDYFAGDNEIHE